jgi:lipoyl-dependent peroxiredoxin
MRAFAVGRFGETERPYHKLIYWHEAEEGGHFAAWEQPEIVAVELRALIAAPIAQPAWKGTHTMSQLEKVLYTTKTHTSGGRDGASRSIDGHLDVKLSRPGGPGGGTNPEQLFAAGWWACFMSSMQLVAGKMKVALPTDLAIDAEVDLGPMGDAYEPAVRLNVSLPGIEPEVGQRLVEAAHHVCPYSRATRQYRCRD